MNLPQTFSRKKHLPTFSLCDARSELSLWMSDSLTGPEDSCMDIIPLCDQVNNNSEVSIVDRNVDSICQMKFVSSDCMTSDTLLSDSAVVNMVNTATAVDSEDCLKSGTLDCADCYNQNIEPTVEDSKNGHTSVLKEFCISQGNGDYLENMRLDCPQCNLSDCTQCNRSDYTKCNKTDNTQCRNRNVSAEGNRTGHVWCNFSPAELTDLSPPVSTTATSRSQPEGDLSERIVDISMMDIGQAKKRTCERTLKQCSDGEAEKTSSSSSSSSEDSDSDSSSSSDSESDSSQSESSKSSSSSSSSDSSSSTSSSSSSSSESESSSDEEETKGEKHSRHKKKRRR